MADAAKERLHKLVDALAESEVEAAEEDIRQGRTRPLDEVMKAFGYES